MASAGRARIRGRAARRRVFTGSPSLRMLPRRNVGLPGVWTVPLLRAVVVHPAGCALPKPFCGEAAIALGQSNALGTRDGLVFVAAFPTAHTLARLRIAGRVAARRRKTGYRLGGLTPRRTGLAPAGRCTEFHEIIAPLTPFGPGSPGRTGIPSPRYRDHVQGGSSIFLFARLRADDRAFRFLGPARYESHESELGPARNESAEDEPTPS